MQVIELLTLPASSDERLYNAAVSVRLSVCLSRLATAAAGLLLWVRRAGDIDQQRRAHSSSGAASRRRAARRSAANVSSAMFIVDV